MTMRSNRIKKMYLWMSVPTYIHMYALCTTRWMFKWASHDRNSEVGGLSRILFVLILYVQCVCMYLCIYYTLKLRTTPCYTDTKGYNWRVRLRPRRKIPDFPRSKLTEVTIESFSTQRAASSLVNAKIRS